MHFNKLVPGVLGSALLLLASGCASTPPELKYVPPEPGVPAATIAMGAGTAARISMIDGKEPPSFASSVQLSAGTHRVMFSCAQLFADLHTSLEHVSVEGTFEAGRKYFTRCEFQGDKAQLWLAGSPDGPPLQGFAGNPAIAVTNAPAPAAGWALLLPSMPRYGSLETVSLVAPASAGDWAVGSSSDRAGRTIVEFVPKGESINSWTRLLTIQYLETKGTSPQEVMDGLRSAMQARCPAVAWDVIQQDATSVLYEWRISGCGASPDQYEMARLLIGNEGMQRVAFTVKGSGLTPAERDNWVKSLSEAYVTKSGKRVVLQP